MDARWRWKWGTGSLLKVAREFDKTVGVKMKIRGEIAWLRNRSHKFDKWVDVRMRGSDESVRLNVNWLHGPQLLVCAFVRSKVQAITHSSGNIKATRASECVDDNRINKRL